MDISVKIRSYLQIFRELGITGLNTEAEAMAERNLFLHPEEPAELWEFITTILSYIGMGHYDERSWHWSPSSDTVYSFDPEALDSRKMYSLFLQGLSAITNGECTLAVGKEYEATEEEQHKVHFYFHGRSCEYTAKSSGDWFDLHILNEINALLKEEGIRKRFFFLVSGCQMIVIFYNTAEWAAAFTDRLDAPLYEYVDF